MNVNFFRKRVFADVIKDLGMRSSWVTWLVPKSNGKCRTREEETHTGRRGGHVRTEAGLRATRPRGEGCPEL